MRLLRFGRWRLSLSLIVFENCNADGDAFIADVRSGMVAWAGNEFPDLFLGLVTKGTGQAFTGGRHISQPTSPLIEKPAPSGRGFLLSWY